MLDVEVLTAPGGVAPLEARELCAAAATALGVGDGHVAIEFVDERRMRELNARHRGNDEPTDVLSFPIDGSGPAGAGPRELGDIVICAAHTADIREAIVHGMLHLLGMDHETDEGEMLELQRRLLAARAG
jgi:probable rRNA maturation factor